MSEWRTKSLGDVAVLKIGRTPPRDEPRYWTTELDRPFCSIADMTNRDVQPSREGVTEAAEHEGKAKRFPAGSLLMSFKLSIGRLGFAQVDLFPNEAIVGIDVSGSPEITPEFLAYALEVQDLELFAGQAVKGKTLNRVSLESIPVRYPLMPAQRRIVDLAYALDANIAALENEREQCLALLDASLDLGFSTPDALFRAVGELVSARSGPSWSAQDETDEPREGALPVIKITNTRPDGSFDHRQLAFVQSLPTSTTTLSESSIVVIRTNGNRDRIGNVYIPPAAVYGSAVSAFQFHLEILDPTDRDFLYWFLRSPTTQRAMSAAASGTTGLGNLALRTLRTLPVPWPDKAARDVLCSRCRAIAAVIKGLAEECESLRRLRATLLPALLSGDVEIPESYDDLVGVT